MGKLDKHRIGVEKTQEQIETKESLVKELHKAGQNKRKNIKEVI